MILFISFSCYSVALFWFFVTSTRDKHWKFRAGWNHFGSLLCWNAETCDHEHRARSYPILSFPILSYPNLSYPMLDGCSFDSFDEGGMEVRQIDSLPQNLMAAARIAAREVVRDLNRESQLPPTLMNLPDPSKRPIQRLFKGKTNLLNGDLGWCAVWLKSNLSKQEIAANYEKYIRARDPFPWRSIHQNLNSLGNSLCSDSNLAGASLCRYNFCTWQVWHETHLPVYRYTVKACAKFVLMTRKWNTTKWNFNHAGMCITVMS